VIIAPQAIQDFLEELEASRAWVFLTKTRERSICVKTEWVGLIVGAGDRSAPDPIYDSASCLIPPGKAGKAIQALLSLIKT
jgi:hypothetical protein